MSFELFDNNHAILCRCDKCGLETDMPYYNEMQTVRLALRTAGWKFNNNQLFCKECYNKIKDMNKQFVKIPSYGEDENRELDCSNIVETYVNKNLIVNIESQYNDITDKEETYFWTVDGGEYYCPLKINELLKLLNN